MKLATWNINLHFMALLCTSGLDISHCSDEIFLLI